MFFKPITVTSASLASETSRTGVMGLIGWNTTDLKNVIAALDAFHRAKSQKTEGALMAALVTWRTKNPNEFANRDRISGGMCKKLAIELGVDDLRDNTIKSVRLIGALRNNPLDRPIPQVKLGTVTVPEQMAGLGGGLGVVLIDVQAQHVGLNVRWDGVTTVLENMIAVLDKARALNLPIMEFWMGANAGPSQTLPEIRNKLGNNLTTERKPTHNAFEGTNLAAWLTQHALTEVVVMGYNANQCVGATIFGGKGRPTAQGAPHIPGLLDRGINVLTSRGILASGETPLMASEGWPYMGPCKKI